MTLMSSVLGEQAVYTAATATATPTPPEAGLSGYVANNVEASYSSFTQEFFNLAGPLLGIFAGIVLIVGLFRSLERIARGFTADGVKTLVLTTAVGGILLFAPVMLNSIIGVLEPLVGSPSAPANPSPTPSASAMASEPVQQASVDWSLVAAIIVIVAALAAVGVALWYFIPHLNAKQKEAAQKRRVISETRELHQKRFNTLKSLENELIERWVKHHTLEETFRTPALSDNRIPETRAAVIAYGKLLANSVPKLVNPDEDPHQSEYGKSVYEFRDRLQEAVLRAEDIRKNGTHFSPDELADIEKAARFIAILGEGSGATVGEKQMALNRLRKIVERLTFLDVTEAQEALKNQLTAAERTVLQLEA